jgi:phosphatidate cytidylyltransferase
VVFPAQRFRISLFIGFVVTLGAWEWARLAGLGPAAARGVCRGGRLLLLLMYILPDLAPWVLGAAVIWWALATWLVLTYPRQRAVVQCRLQAADRPADPAAGLAGAGAAQALAAGQLVDPGGHGAGLGCRHRRLFLGRAFGKRKLAPQVSPGKSWEGVYGGLAVSLAITWRGISRDWTVSCCLACWAPPSWSCLGGRRPDREHVQAPSGIKDSSNLLPGHGGVLDRIDSLTAAIPIFAVLLWPPNGV